MFIVAGLYFYIQRLEYLSEIVIVFNASSAVFQLYYGENKLISNEMMIRSVLC
jgi:hypothetical protein